MNRENIEKICQSVFDSIIKQKDEEPFFNYDGIRVGYCVYRLKKEVTACFTAGDGKNLVSFEIKFYLDQVKLSFVKDYIQRTVKKHLEKAIEKLKTKTENPETKEN